MQKSLCFLPGEEGRQVPGVAVGDGVPRGAALLPGVVAGQGSWWAAGAQGSAEREHRLCPKETQGKARLIQLWMLPERDGVGLLMLEKRVTGHVCTYTPRQGLTPCLCFTPFTVLISVCIVTASPLSSQFVSKFAFGYFLAC